MNSEIRKSIKALMMRYLSSGTEQGLFHSLVIAKAMAEDSVTFEKICQDFPVCEISDDGEYRVDGGDIYWLNLTEKELVTEIDRLRNRLV